MNGRCIAVYYQSTAPTGEALRYGDRWYDHSDGLKLYIFTGEAWEDLND